LKITLPSIEHTFEGFRTLVNVHKSVEDAVFEDIEFDMSSTRWFDADMCAAFGAILYGVSANLNSIELTHIIPRVEDVLRRNGFLSHYGRTQTPDRWRSTIPYQRFEIKDDRYFAKYIEDKFIRRTEMPGMSVPLQKKFRESVSEIFSNSVIHSQTKMGIFSCGQFFPGQHCLVFSVADLGIGIRENVKQHTGFDMAADQAIAWATQGTNTTKRGRIPGGLGLKLLREFISMNRGSLRIVSDAGYWCLSADGFTRALLPNRFPGTVVNIEIKTSDTNSYALASELTESDIF
jgi:hypothetical protein